MLGHEANMKVAARTLMSSHLSGCEWQNLGVPKQRPEDAGRENRAMNRSLEAIKRPSKPLVPGPKTNPQ